jgi:hypothetical protein
MLPVCSRNRAKTNETATTETMNPVKVSTIDCCPPATKNPVTINGTCHRAQITPPASTGYGIPPSISRVSM